MATYYDDNFGTWNDMNDLDVQEFYQEVQSKSVLKRCEGCGRMVRILPHYGYCNSCANAREIGAEY